MYIKTPLNFIATEYDKEYLLDLQIYKISMSNSEQSNFKVYVKTFLEKWPPLHCLLVYMKYVITLFERNIRL